MVPPFPCPVSSGGGGCSGLKGWREGWRDEEKGKGKVRDRLLAGYRSAEEGV